MLCGSAFKNKGVQQLLDAVVDFLPSPLDIPPIEGHTLDGEPESRPPDDDAPFAALAFKIMTDPFVGQLTFVRVYSGTSADSATRCSTRAAATPSGSGACSRCTPTSARRSRRCYAGDIAAVVGLRNVATGDTICDPSAPRSCSRRCSSRSR